MLLKKTMICGNVERSIEIEVARLGDRQSYGRLFGIDGNLAFFKVDDGNDGYSHNNQTCNESISSQDFLHNALISVSVFFVAPDSFDSIKSRAIVI